MPPGALHVSNSFHGCCAQWTPAQPSIGVAAWVAQTCAILTCPRAWPLQVEEEAGWGEGDDAVEDVADGAGASAAEEHELQAGAWEAPGDEPAFLGAAQPAPDASSAAAVDASSWGQEGAGDWHADAAQDAASREQPAEQEAGVQEAAVWEHQADAGWSPDAVGQAAGWVEEPALAALLVTDEQEGSPAADDWGQAGGDWSESFVAQPGVAAAWPELSDAAAGAMPPGDGRDHGGEAWQAELAAGEATAVPEQQGGWDGGDGAAAFEEVSLSGGADAAGWQQRQGAPFEWTAAAETQPGFSDFGWPAAEQGDSQQRRPAQEGWGDFGDDLT